MKKEKHYIVLKGRKVGIFNNWEDCKAQVFGFSGAVYKSFESRQLAEEALANGNIAIKKVESATCQNRDNNKYGNLSNPITQSISVDGAWNTVTGIAEYQGVETLTGKVVFKGGPFQQGTNNLVEFLAIVHALAYCKQKDVTVPI